MNLKKEQVYKKDKSALNCLTVVLRHYQALFFFFSSFFFVNILTTTHLNLWRLETVPYCWDTDNGESILLCRLCSHCTVNKDRGVNVVDWTHVLWLDCLFQMYKGFSSFTFEIKDFSNHIEKCCQNSSKLFKV